MSQVEDVPASPEPRTAVEEIPAAIRSIEVFKFAPLESPINEDDIADWIVDLRDLKKREKAMLELSKRRDDFPELPIWLWHSYGTMAILLQELLAIYPLIAKSALSGNESNRVCNALALMQCVASHRETRLLFLRAHMPLHIIPFLHTTIASKPFQFLRLTSLGVIGALVKINDEEAVQFLLSTDIVPLCLRIMVMDTELSKTVATFIIQKIVLNDTGLDYICQIYVRFNQVSLVLGKVSLRLVEEPSPRLLKHVIRCYCRLTENDKAKQTLRECLPEPLRNPAPFQAILEKDQTSRTWLKLLLKTLDIDPPSFLDE